jgi:hypothetical protein
MTNGIDECSIVIVFVTREYIHKCMKEAHDNCKIEFEYAYQRKTVTWWLWSLTVQTQPHGMALLVLHSAPSCILAA